MRDRSLLVRAVAALLVPALGLMWAPSAPASASAGPSYVTAAEYFGDGNPTNMWNSGLWGAPQAFVQMKEEGFNTVALIVPWGEFQTGVDPVREDSASFARLDRLIADAKHLGMGVILRLSYEWDNDPADQMQGQARFTALWSNETVYQAWLDYISAVRHNVAHFGNVREAYLSWEDLWEPVSESAGTTTAHQQLTLAKTLGYRTWLKSTQSLRQVGRAYGTTFGSWNQVPTPASDQPSFKLILEYEDWALVHRLFIPASKRFPGLTMETRVDVDPLHNGSQVIGAFTHEEQYQLPGAAVTGMYFSPYQGDPSSTHVESATDALSALRSTLTKMSGGAGGRRLFIYEYEIESNSPQVSTDPALTPTQIPAFVSASEPLLRQDTAGYALWTYHDYVQSPFFNQSFSLGSAGWKVSHGARVVTSSTTASYALLGKGGQVSQRATTVGSSAPGTVSFQAESSQPATVLVRWGGGGPERVRVSSGWHTYTVTPPASGTDTLAISATGPTSVTDVQLYTYTQEGDILGVTGQPEVGAAAVRSLNQALSPPA